MDSSSNKTKHDSEEGPRYRIGKQIAAGSFGTVRHGVNLSTNEPVAIKLERTTARGATLPIEYKIYQILGEQEGVPRIFYFGPVGKYNALVMEILGPSIEKCFQTCKRKFTLKTTIQTIIQMVRRIEFVHSKGIIYRDIKPENFLFGPPNSSNENILHIVDFGLSKLYIDPTTSQHIPYRENRSRTGTARYMSVNSHLGREQSRRDDLESIGYVLVYLGRGSLPWQGTRIRDKELRYKAILDKKQGTTTEKLCQGLPEEIRNFIHYVKSLQFYDKPDYEKLVGLLSNLFRRKKFLDDGLYDWNPPTKKSNSLGAKSVISIKSLR